MSDRDDHYELGRKDAYHGEPRYKFQDPVLQTRYDKGYNEVMRLGEEYLHSDDPFNQRVPGLPGRVVKRRT